MRNCFLFPMLRVFIFIIAQNLIVLSFIHASPQVEESKLESVKQVTQLIFSIPETERNFNNTLGVWNRLLTRLSYNSLTDDVKPDWQLQELFTQVALNVIEDEETDSIQKQVASYFLTSPEKGGFGDFLYFRGNAEEQRSRSEKFSLLNLSAKSLPDDRSSDFVDHLIVISPDIIYLQEVFNFETAYRFFDGLKNNYAYFFILANQGISKCSFIASKYKLDGIQFYPLNDGNSAEGFFDFMIRSERSSLVHVYAMRLAEALDPWQFEKILEKFQGDLLESSQVVSVVLCGNLCPLKNPLIISSIQDYFSVESSKDYNAFLLKPLSQMLSNPYHQEYALIDSPVSFLNCLSGTLFYIQENNIYSSCSIFRNGDNKMDGMLEGNYTLLAAGGASVSASQDSRGNSAVEVEVKTSRTTESGNTYSWSTSGSVSRDERGDTSGKIEATFELNW